MPNGFARGRAWLAWSLALPRAERLRVGVYNIYSLDISALVIEPSSPTVSCFVYALASIHVAVLSSYSSPALYAVQTRMRMPCTPKSRVVRLYRCMATQQRLRNKIRLVR